MQNQWIGDAKPVDGKSKAIVLEFQRRQNGRFFSRLVFSEVNILGFKLSYLYTRYSLIMNTKNIYPRIVRRRPTRFRLAQ